MNLKKYLIKYKDNLKEPKECSFWKTFINPNIKGVYNNYEAEFGVKIGKSQTYTYDDYCKIKLKRPPKLPLYLNFSLHLGGNLYLKNGWLTLYHFGAYASKSEMVKYFDTKFEKALQTNLQKLETKIKEIEENKLDLKKYKTKQIKELKKWLTIWIVIVAAVIGICVLSL